MYIKDFMYMGFSGSTQHSIKVHNVEWCIAKEVVRLTTVTRWSRDLGMAKGRGNQKNVVVFWLGLVSVGRYGSSESERKMGFKTQNHNHSFFR